MNLETGLSTRGLPPLLWFLQVCHRTANKAGLLPPTDVRWWPDQWALEDGKIAEAENIKLGVEQAQRDRRKQRETEQKPQFAPLWFTETKTDTVGELEE